ncbi:MAG: membrane protein insertase YidC, partial [Actinomycetota bacterium]
ANTAQVANTETAPTPQVQATPPSQQQTTAISPDNTPNKQITIKSSLYEVKLDSKGALATSWILFKDKSPKGEREIFADGSTDTEKKPLQLISDEAKNRNPRELPFRLSTDDQNLNTILNDRNYQVSADETITLTEGQEKQIDFTLTDENGTEVKKTFIFRADSYLADLQVKLTRNGQTVPNTKLLIGSSIGDQGIVYHNFYHIEPEAVSLVKSKIQRYPGASFTYKDVPVNKDGQLVNESQATQSFDGAVDWGGVADAYFAMVAVPAQQTQGLEYRAYKYEFPVAPYYDGIISWVTRNQKTTETRHLVTAYVPINVDGSTTKIYAGTKDYFALSEYNKTLSESVGRPAGINDLINYGFFGFFTSRLSVPILYSLNFLNNLTNNYGISIIIFTILFYTLLFPLRWSQSKSFKKASGNAPKMKDIQDRIKDLQKKGIPADDPRMRQLQMEQLKMTKDALPIGGCLPMLLQFPLLFAFYTAVTVSLAIRQASFLWLPDLSAGDPYHLLNFIFVGSMVLSMKLTPTTPTVTPEQQMQQKMMTYFMPVMLLWVMWSSPAGLLLYWCVGNFVSFGQQILINRMNKNNEPPKEEIVDTVPKNAKKVKPKLSTS